MSYVTPNPTWYADGLRWIGSLFNDAADAIDTTLPATDALEPVPAYKPVDEFLYDVRFRMQTRQWQ